MFGFGHQAPDSRQEAQLLAIEQAKKVCKVELAKMHDASPEDAERLGKWLKERCGQDKSLPFDFKRRLLERARFHECNANMRSTNQMLHAALRLAAEEHMVERSHRLSEGRRYFAKACALGADEDFRKAVQRLIDNIMMTGGVQHKGPTRAKPADIAPRAPNRAKA